MSIVNYTVNGRKIQSTPALGTYKEGFMLMELVMGICIFIAFMFVAYSYMGMTAQWGGYVVRHNACIDAVVCVCEQGPPYHAGDGISIQTYRHVPEYVRTLVGWDDCEIPAVTQVVVSRSWGTNETKSTVEVQTAY